MYRPLTPLRRCVDVGLLATITGALAETKPQEHNFSTGVEILMHAKVYSFAHRFFWSELTLFALQRLTKVLILVDCKQSHLFPYLGDAIHFVYNNTSQRKTEVEPARKLLSQFVALNYTDLMGEELQMLASEGGEFMIDLSHKLARLLATGYDSNQLLEKKCYELETEVSELKLYWHSKDDEIQRVRDEVDELKRRNELRRRIRELPKKYKKKAAS